MSAQERAEHVLRAGTGITHEDCRQTGNALARDVLALLAELARLEQERDERIETAAADEWLLHRFHQTYDELAAARAREQRLRGALHEISRMPAGADDDGLACAGIARAALAAEPAAGPKSCGVQFTVGGRSLACERPPGHLGEHACPSAVGSASAVADDDDLSFSKAAQPLTQDAGLRKAERTAWHRYRDARAAADEPCECGQTTHANCPRDNECRAEIERQVAAAADEPRRQGAWFDRSGGHIEMEPAADEPGERE